MSVCCAGCFQDDAVIEIIFASTSGTEGPCDYCDGMRGPFAPVGELSEMFRRIVDDNYKPVDQLSQVGGGQADALEESEYLHDLLTEDFDPFNEDADFDKLTSDILNDGQNAARGDQTYEDLWARRSRDWLHMGLQDYWEEFHFAVHRYGHSLARSRGGYGGDRQAHDSVDVLRDSLKHHLATVPARTRLWRARRGGELKAAEMGSPPPGKAPASRGNLQGQPVLYACGDPITATYEIRPSVGDDLTIMRFKLKRDVSVCDLRPNVEKCTPFVRGQAEYDEYKKIAARNNGRWILGNALSRPVRRDDEQQDYLPTQYLAGLIAELGVDGIAFASAQRSMPRGARGTNYLFFDPFIAEPMGEPIRRSLAAVRYSLSRSPVR